MKNNIFINVICIILLVLVLSCSKKEHFVNDSIVIARVNGETLTLEDIKESYGIEQWNEMTRDEQKEIIQQWVDLTILSTYAEKDNSLKDDNALKFIAENAKKKVYANALVSSRLKSLKFTEEELYRYYQLHQFEFVESIREFKVQRIYLNDEEEMRRVKRMLDNKEITFTPAARQFSKEGLAQNDGYMNSSVSKAGPDSLLWRELEKKDKFYEVTMPYRNGFIIARWYDFRMTNYNVTFLDVREQVEDLLREERISDVYEQLFYEARNKANVVIEY